VIGEGRWKRGRGWARGHANVTETNTSGSWMRVYVCAAGTNFIDFHFPPTHMRKLPQGRGSWKSLRYDQENKLSALTAIAYN